MRGSTQSHAVSTPRERALARISANEACAQNCSHSSTLRSARVPSSCRDSINSATASALGVGNAVAAGTAGATISTQAAAQLALEAIDSAISDKDNVRANLGALANRLSNTVSNLTIQAENLQAAESRISDVDVATEMTEFVRNQILTQAAVAMLAQANTLPQLALTLIGA